MMKDFYGVCDFSTPETDFYGAADVVFPDPRHTFQDLGFQYNQIDKVIATLSTMTCTVHGNITALSNNTGVKITDTQRVSLVNQAIAAGLNPTKGWSNYGAKEIVRKWWNKLNPNDTVLSFNIAICSDEFYRVMDQGYVLSVVYRGNAEYNQDAHDNGILENTNIGIASYGHCLAVCKSDDPKYLNLMIESYPFNGKLENYKIAKITFETLVKTGVYSPTGYIYVFQKEYDTMVNDWMIPEFARKAVELARKKGITVDGKTINNPIPNSASEEDMLFKCGALTQKLGYMTVARRLTAYLRKGVL